MLNTNPNATKFRQTMEKNASGTPTTFDQHALWKTSKKSIDIRNLESVLDDQDF